MAMKQVQFFSEMAERQLSAREFFSNELLHLLERNFGLDEMLISYFDTKGECLSWVDKNGLYVDCAEHPYRKFFVNDVVRHTIYNEAVRDHLTYFNVEPRLYRSTDIIDAVDYDTSAYVRFLEENFNAHYSVTLAFGINAYIQVAFFKSLEQGDFTAEEMEKLNSIYVIVANSYKTFKKHEQGKIVLAIHNKIIASGDKAFLVTDDFKHILDCNETAKTYLVDIFGEIIPKDLHSDVVCDWLPMLIGDSGTHSEQIIAKRIIKNYVFKIHVFDQGYSNKIVDRYYWITISNKEDGSVAPMVENTSLTKTEQKVAELIYQGLTYKAIANELVISYHTVKKHVQNIYTKCGVNSRYELYNWLDENKK
ncbi:response regulator transcription factor [Chakrabartyella piscis]|uniref:response regulator transcription factor n=1 Tax=Chakrabartyella piscis TaxID=2918914 RepID=UPI0029585A76|nr:LuxR C-terminal-related transcriptional regulator [Chakrabartyella piscis]